MNWPRSLLARNALLIVALIVLGQLGGALLMRQMVVLPRMAQTADGVARTLGAIRAGLAALPPAERGAFVDAFNARARAALAAEQRNPLPPPRVLLAPLERRFVRQVSERLEGQGIDVVWRRDAGGSLALRQAAAG
ncbi:MAG TPA: two-component sensor histidine kinase, partial [Ottowia sp.]|nr:two-component sensor histidine kinase [Ottowia sp.]